MEKTYFSDGPEKLTKNLEIACLEFAKFIRKLIDCLFTILDEETASLDKLYFFYCPDRKFYISKTF